MMYRVRRLAFLLITAVFVTTGFLIFGLPYANLTWASILPQYLSPTTVPSAAVTTRSPSGNLDPNTANAYTDSNGGLTAGIIYAIPLDAAGIGNPSVIARGVVAAYEFQVIGGDPFAPFPIPVRACIRGVGTAVFIPKMRDGSGVPTDLPSAPSEGANITCAFIFQPGSLIIVNQ